MNSALICLLLLNIFLVESYIPEVSVKNANKNILPKLIKSTLISSLILTQIMLPNNINNANAVVMNDNTMILTRSTLILADEGESTSKVILIKITLNYDYN